MVFDHTVMPEVIPAPQDNVIPDGNKGLDRIVFENEAVLADLYIGKNSGLRTHIADAVIAHFQGLLEDTSP